MRNYIFIVKWCTNPMDALDNAQIRMGLEITSNDAQIRRIPDGLTVRRCTNQDGIRNSSSNDAQIRRMPDGLTVRRCTNQDGIRNSSSNDAQIRRMPDGLTVRRCTNQDEGLWIHDYNIFTQVRDGENNDGLMIITHTDIVIDSENHE